MSRYFEKISNKQFLTDFNNFDITYDDIKIPVRKTSFSAGYDFISCFDFELKPNEILKVPTGIKVKMLDNEFLGIYIRSSLGFKHNVRLCNQVGIIDSDYYNNNDNEGHIWICLQNHGTKSLTIKKGESFAQGIFQSYFLVDNDNVQTKRISGIGSTNKGDDDNGK